MKSAVTISLVPEARGGPFVFFDDLPAACRKAAELGFDGVEVFAPSAEAVRDAGLRATLAEYRLQLAAVGTGAGWVKHQWSLTSPDPDVRRRAVDFVAGTVDAAGSLGAPAIIGSMQGRWSTRPEGEARQWLCEALETCAAFAARHGVPLLYEPLNRYETNLVNTVEHGVELLKSLATDNVRLLADLFHMNIEERDPADAIRAGGALIGHVHLADSNRRPAGFGHTEFSPIAEALHEIGYGGYLSAEALPFPNSNAAAEATMNAFKYFFRRQ